MGIFTITINKKLNQPPSKIQGSSITIPFETKQTYFTESNFNTDYLDPENDPIFKLKILTLPNYGILKFNNVNVSLNQEILMSNISQLELDITNETTSDLTTSFQFTLSDVGSEEFYENSIYPEIEIIINPEVNLPPSSIGDNDFEINETEIITFTEANFTTETTPPYSDPENDDPAFLKITSLPTSGNLKYNNSNIILNQEISFSDINNGLFTYVPDINTQATNTTDPNFPFYEVEFNFEISDLGSLIFVE